MYKYNNTAAILSAALILTGACCSFGADIIAADPCAVTAGAELARSGIEQSSARLEPARMGEAFGIAVVFEGTADLHYYATPESAPAPGFELKVTAESAAFEFGPPAFPKWSVIKDAFGGDVEVYAGAFNVFVPITSARTPATGAGDVRITITGTACTSMICLPDFTKTLGTQIDWSARDSWKAVTLEAAGESGPAQAAGKPSLSAWLALLLALAAGVTLNIMPCVLPVIPLKVLSIFDQAKESKARGIALGLAFCVGILLFFAVIAVVTIILRLGYGTTLGWGQHFQNPAIVIAMSLLLVVVALFMFGTFTVTVPSSVAGRSGPRKGYVGSAAMGFFAAILSTPCSFGILALAFGWAQTQRLPLATLTIMLIGVGMALPYAILTSVPSLLKYVPKAGRWTELFKQSMGFVLLIVAAWLVTVLPQKRQLGVLFFAVILSFCLWMWGGWVNLMTPRRRKIVIRVVALAIVLLSAAFFLPEPRVAEIDWQDYEKSAVDEAFLSGSPVLIEFTAGWCMNCKFVEKLVYSRSDIADLIRQKGVVPFKADTTLRESPAAVDLKEVYGQVGVPVTVLFSPGKSEPDNLPGVVIHGRLKKLLKALPDRPADPNEQGDS
ncbi:MAG: thioredoxin family protein [Phycisphaerales bacterium]|nr:MAG: thioredoxin family protein [Phycisphaerales bacterium]